MHRQETAKTNLHDHIYKWYVKYNGIYRDKINEIENKIDQMILTISSGAILLTITFYDMIVKKSIIQDYTILIKTSWIAFIIAIIATLTANRISIIILGVMQKKLRKGYENAANQIDNNKMPEFPDISSGGSKCISFLNIVAYLGLVIGIILCIVFAYWSF